MSFFLSWLEPSFNALNPFNSLPFTYRWRLLLFQPLALLINTTKYLTCLLSYSHTYTIHHIPTRTGAHLRTLIFHPPSSSNQVPPLRPLHLHLHAGGFLGGIPENDVPFLSALAARTGALIVAPTYRLAPLHPFPAAINDVDDAIAHLHSHAATHLHASPALLTISGFSAGANLALAATQQPPCRAPVPTSIKASVTFYAPLDLRVPPWQKQKPPGFPRADPLAFLLPLLDAYAGSEGVREANGENPRLHPGLAEAGALPERMLLVVPTVDILVKEQLVFVERLRGEGKEGVDSLVVEGQWHGWVESECGPSTCNHGAR